MQGVTRKTISFPSQLAKEIATLAADEHRDFSKQVVAICQALFFDPSRQTARSKKDKK
jgi:hypothetical protein